MNLTHLVQPETNEHIAHYNKRFVELEHGEQVCLLIMSVIHKPIGIAKLEQVIKHLCDAKFLIGQPADYQLAADRRQILIKQSILVLAREGLYVNRLSCNSLTLKLSHLESLGEAIGKPKLVHILMAAEQVVPVVQHYPHQDKLRNKRRLLRDFYFLNELDNLETQLSLNKNPQLIDPDTSQVLVELCFLPFDIERFITLPANIRYTAFAILLRLSKEEGSNVAHCVSLLKQTVQAIPDDRLCTSLLAEQYLFSAQLDNFIAIHDLDDNSCYGLQLSASYYLLNNQIEKALALFAQALKAKDKLGKKRRQYLGGQMGFMHKLCLLVYAHQHDPRLYAQACQQLQYEQDDTNISDHFFAVSADLREVAKSLLASTDYRADPYHSRIHETVDFFTYHLTCFVELLGNIWCNAELDEGSKSLLFQKGLASIDAFENISQYTLATFCHQIMKRLGNQKLSSSERISDDQNEILLDIAYSIKPRERWELALEKLIALNPSAIEQKDSSTASTSTRLIWELHQQRFTDELVPREQKQTKSGWSKGKVISLKRLKDGYGTMPHLSDSDMVLCKAIEEDRYHAYHAKVTHKLEGLAALLAACDIDNLYLSSDLTRPIELKLREPELIISEQAQHLCLSLSSAPTREDGSSSYTLTQESERVFSLTQFNDSHVQVSKVIGEEGLLVPLEAKQKVLQGISAIAPFLNIQSDLSDIDTGLSTLTCDPHLVINIQPFEAGLSFHCVVMPFGEEGACYPPGIGNASLSAQVGDKRLAVHRDLINEQRLLDELDAACPVFLATSDNQLLLPEPQHAIEALEQLEHIQRQQNFELLLRWPAGKRLNLSKPIGQDQMQLAMTKSNEWFDMTGQLQVDDEQVIDLRALLTLMSTSNGRYVTLDDDKVLVLTEQLKERLTLLAHALQGERFHRTAALQVEHAISGMRMKTIDAWDQQTRLMHQSNQLSLSIPSTLKAKLRDYQKVGFDWAMRLAHWGAGACLADDMGLGKTLQALAVVLARADKGPTLILAPTSVCFNWQQEIHKFAPTLVVRMFNEASGSEERTQLIESLGEFDCLVVSYGLLQREGDLLASRTWQTLIADEAQALKNPLAQRTKAAYALDAKFKMITTGTPIENDLTELWSLFRIINPGLLGNLKAFSQRFIEPIANEKENRLDARRARQGLKSLIQAFILRRLKSQVLSELPSRTELNISVKMGAKEQAFYEALRLNAVDNIQSASANENAAEQRIRMLAELTKLRQACCHPKLVMAESEIPSAKLAALEGLLDELLANKHKTLIFSQFVGHLKLIKQLVEAKGIPFQYLDGSTPQKSRQQRVNAFQRGEGDVFLISLKAGGFGLNLTAADYVIHMDPWWNPAVEDQASDRAHRMGQTRPVTIYRLITEHTIEEKIMSLHKHKRDLADQVLAGNETASKLSVDEMLLLLKDTF